MRGFKLNLVKICQGLPRIRASSSTERANVVKLLISTHYAVRSSDLLLNVVTLVLCMYLLVHLLVCLVGCIVSRFIIDRLF